MLATRVDDTLNKSSELKEVLKYHRCLFHSVSSCVKDDTKISSFGSFIKKHKLHNNKDTFWEHKIVSTNKYVLINAFYTDCFSGLGLNNYEIKIAKWNVGCWSRQVKPITRILLMMYLVII